MGINVDVGATYTFEDKLSIGVKAENLKPKSFASATGETYHVKKQITGGIAARFGVVTVMADDQFNINNGYKAIEETQ